MAKFRKKPVIIEAEQFTNEAPDYAFNFITCNKTAGFNEDGSKFIKIQTLEGIMKADIGDWIIKGVNGEFYPCKPDIFEATYEMVDAKTRKWCVEISQNGWEYIGYAYIKCKECIKIADKKY